MTKPCCHIFRLRPRRWHLGARLFAGWLAHKRRSGAWAYTDLASMLTVLDYDRSISWNVFLGSDRADGKLSVFVLREWSIDRARESIEAWVGASCTVEHIPDEQWQQEMREKYDKAE